MNENIKKVRIALNLSQEQLGKILNLSKATICSLENGNRKPTSRIINDICDKLNISKEWFLTGNGEMFKEKDISLDEYLQNHNATQLEINIIKKYFQLPVEIRQITLNYFKHLFDDDEISAAKNKEQEINDEINKEVENYRKELEAEYKGEGKLKVSLDSKRIKEA